MLLNNSAWCQSFVLTSALYQTRLYIQDFQNWKILPLQLQEKMAHSERKKFSNFNFANLYKYTGRLFHWSKITPDIVQISTFPLKLEQDIIRNRFLFNFYCWGLSCGGENSFYTCSFIPFFLFITKAILVGQASCWFYLIVAYINLIFQNFIFVLWDPWSRTKYENIRVLHRTFQQKYVPIKLLLYHYLRSFRDIHCTV